MEGCYIFQWLYPLWSASGGQVAWPSCSIIIFFFLLFPISLTWDPSGVKISKRHGSDKSLSNYFKTSLDFHHRGPRKITVLDSNFFILPLNIEMKSYMGTPTAPLVLIFCKRENSHFIRAEVDRMLLLASNRKAL